MTRQLVFTAFLAAAAAVTLPFPIAAKPLVWLAPESLPLELGAISVWPNLASSGSVYDAAVDSDPNQAAAPILFPNATGPFSAVFFSTTGRFALGSNLVVPIDLSAGNDSSIFFVSKIVGGGDSVWRLLAARNNNWFLGYHNHSQDNAYASPTDDGVFLANLSTPLTYEWVAYELEVIGGTSSGRAFRNNALIGSGPAIGPNFLRLGGGINKQAAEYGTGLIAEVVVFDQALPSKQRAAMQAYFRSKYGL